MASAKRAHLPFELNSFVGRTRELEDLARLCAQARLTTLTGPPGVGKSRLARRVATVVTAEFSGDVGYLDVGSIGEPELLPGRVGVAVGLKERAAADAAEDLAERLGTRELMLILDDCEHLLDACARLVMVLLGACGNLRVLVTSRERLGVPGETLWQVEPLGLPPAHATSEAVGASDAARLLVERIIEVDPHFVLDDSNARYVAQICHQLDGLPFALELAAAWESTLSVAEIAARLDDPLRLLNRGGRGAPGRHQTLRATLEWSTSQMGEVERQLLRRLGVFSGTWDFAAARGVCADSDAESTHLLSTLAELVTKSLVQVVPHSEKPGPARYRLLGVVRQYALEELERETELEDRRARHAQWYRGVAESIHISSVPADQLVRLFNEYDNLREALRWAVAGHEVDASLALAIRLHAVWYMQGQYVESQRWFAQVLALTGGSPGARAMVETWASAHALSRGDIAGAQAHVSIARSAADSTQDDEVRIFSLDGQASMLLDAGELDSAADVLAEEQALLEGRDGYEWLLAAVLYRLASIELEFGQPQQAEALLDSAERFLSTSDNAWLWLRIRRGYARLALERSDLQTATTALETVLGGAREIGDLRGMCEALTDLAQIAHLQRRTPECRRLLHEALEVARRDSGPLVLIRVLEGAVSLFASGRPEAALQLAGAASGIRAAIGAHAWPLERARLERALDVAHGRVGSAAAEGAVTTGRLFGHARAATVAGELLDVPAAPPSRTSASRAALTSREQEVARLVARGLTNRAIANALVISEGTVRAHVEHILGKLDLRSRTEIGEHLAWTDEVESIS